MARALMIQGTGSGAGKSLIAAALCRIFSDRGVNVAPFKSQNMALNSFITREGGEIGRAQALQAEAARIEPTVDMNPILLKASGEIGSQVIIHGTVHSTMKARDYYAFRSEAWSAVTASYERLSSAHDLIIIEGAGSPAEINLMDVDIVNMRVAEYAKAPVLLVGDIDKGGVFASLYGTVKLLGKGSRHIKGFIVNKFRGDIEILNPGLEMIKEKTHKPVIGVLPYIHSIGLPEEDGLGLMQGSRAKGQGSREIKIVVVKLRFISNFTDFDALAHEPDVDLSYSTAPSDIENADMVIIPGSKNTVADLLLLKEFGFVESIKRAYEKGVQIVGVCGGYQMLGKKLFDPHAVESNQREVEGIGLLNIETTFNKIKITRQVQASLEDTSLLATGDAVRVRGYEIHMGESRGDIGLFSISSGSCGLDGSRNINCWGTYIHGLFDNDAFRRGLLNRMRIQKGLSPLPETLRYEETKEKALDKLAALVSEHLDMEFIRRLVKL